MGVRRYVRIAIGVAAVGALGFGAAAGAHGGRKGFSERLSGFEEVPARLSPGSGTFKAKVKKGGSEVEYRLSYSGLSSDVLQAHIHFENATNNGPVVVFLCSNLTGAPAGTPACPATGGTVTGSFTAEDVLGNAASQGLNAGDFAGLLRAMRAGATYVNVHTSTAPGGEIRAQLD